MTLRLTLAPVRGGGDESPGPKLNEVLPADWHVQGIKKLGGFIIDALSMDQPAGEPLTDENSTNPSSTETDVQTGEITDDGLFNLGIAGKFKSFSNAMSNVAEGLGKLLDLTQVDFDDDSNSNEQSNRNSSATNPFEYTEQKSDPTYDTLSTIPIYGRSGVGTRSEIERTGGFKPDSTFTVDDFNLAFKAKYGSR
ncbi:MAG: hypothetical protein RJQ09_13285 [Cyclobacteriaceae bacterium]